MKVHPSVKQNGLLLQCVLVVNCLKRLTWIRIRQQTERKTQSDRQKKGGEREGKKEKGEEEGEGVGGRIL